MANSVARYQSHGTYLGRAGTTTQTLLTEE